MSELIARFTSLPGYGVGGLLVLLLYALESEVRFGPRARAHGAGAFDRKSTLAVSCAAAVSVLGFVLAMKSDSADIGVWLPRWFRTAAMPGLPSPRGVGSCSVPLAVASAYADYGRKVGALLPRIRPSQR